MDLVLLIGSFFVMLFLGVPIAFALCTSSLAYLVLFSRVPVVIVAQQMLKGVDSFTLMAIPFFVIVPFAQNDSASFQDSFKNLFFGILIS